MAQKVIVVKIEGKSEWKCLRAKGGNGIAVCDPLALTIQSETWATVMEDSAHTLNAMFVDLLQSNELERFLSDRGWKPVGRIPEKAANIRFDLPFVSRLAEPETQVALREQDQVNRYTLNRSGRSVGGEKEERITFQSHEQISSKRMSSVSPSVTPSVPLKK
jgi:hypothetical protein